MSAQAFDPSNPLYYDQYFGYDAESAPCEVQMQDEIYGEYIAIYGKKFSVYLCTHFQPEYIFGEDPLKKYSADPFYAKGMFDMTSEALTFGEWEKNTEVEEITIYFHKTTIRTSVKETLISAGLLEDETILDESTLTKIQRNRLDLQEGDIIKLHFNNIHYEIDGIKLEPEFQHHAYKYVYEVHARPRLISGEDIGDMQSVTEAEDIREQHEYEIEIEADKIIF